MAIQQHCQREFKDHIMTKKTISYSMADVARLANVSVGTVSAVINNKGIVSEEKTRRVKEAMLALNYQPDHVARSLKVGRTNVIGMIVPDITNLFFTEVMKGVEKEAWANGYSMMLCNTNEDPVQEQHYVNMLLSRRVDGIVLAGANPAIAYEHQNLRRIPIIFVDRVPTGITSNAVTTDNVMAAYDATKYLIDLGHKRIAIITGYLHLSPGAGRAEGFRKAMQEAHLPIHDEYFKYGDFQIESGYCCGMELLKLDIPPTAIFSCNNKMTLGLIRAISELKIPCPQRLSVLGFDDFDWAANFTPKLTTIAQPTTEMGRQSMRMLLQKIEAAKENIETIQTEEIVLLKAELRIRESTAHPYSD